MRNINNSEHAINFADIKSGDIIIADILNAEDAFLKKTTLLLARVSLRHSLHTQKLQTSWTPM